MGKTHDRLTTELIRWIESQKIFFVATAPMDARLHVNVSPKSAGQFRVLGPLTVAYLDFTGSGNETLAHLLDTDGRITLMMCAFEGSPRILRMFGRGTIVVTKNARLDREIDLKIADPGEKRKMTVEELFGRFAEEDVKNNKGFRAIYVVHLHRISSSCGYSVPFYQYLGERSVLKEVTDKRTPEETDAYWRKKNCVSLDGLPGYATLLDDFRAPREIKREDGFLFAYYDDDDNNKSGNWWWWWWWWMTRLYYRLYLRHRLLVSSKTVAFVVGLLMGAMMHRLLSRRYYRV